MDFQDIFYIIIFIGVALSGLIKNVIKKAKATQQETPQTPSPAVPDVWQELMKELRKQQQPNESVFIPEPVVQSAPQAEKTDSKPFETKYENLEDEADIDLAVREDELTQSLSGNEINDEIQPIAEEQIGDLEVHINSHEELCKAVIYSEILGRKYA